MNTKKLIRPTKGRMLFGVAQGIANYFEIDATIVRLIFVVLTIWGGAGIILYIIGIFIMPDEDNKEISEEIRKNASRAKEEIKKKSRAIAEEIKVDTKEHSKKTYQGSQIFGIIVLVLGLMFLLSNIVTWFSFGKLWPVLLIAIGLIIIAGKGKE